ncbi:DNA-binding response regulator [Staphylococcus felis]|uniref:DNA-binding response regulator n=1 Tax=Staphylococcus felis TaxID=46127 RepID=A0A3E0IP68_9STAP|nr:response regulator transcription factor [Staphylococcus felis]MBH9580288.1 response regulator transcription factor [Staphylococcus felis]MDM8327942.1 response regulator transcription factor [Staphylococcus felis]MDQ7193403.1 response regulator transcription factor [Staphylococcus felis]REH77621.1 DNA-binding response regulator [Staphylococcus felis]REH83297.1 DNA-binding response regulator [Staphylococcus felis]
MINVVLAEDQTMLRQAMVQLMEMHEEINIIENVGDGLEAFRVIQENEVDVVILDVEMPGLTGLEILQLIREKAINVKVIIVTTFKRPGYFEKAVTYDVDAYVLKERSVGELVQTIHRVMRGEKEYSEVLMSSIFTERNPLTLKEQTVLKEIGNGLSNREIAKALFLSNGTVRNYISTIMDKLEADNRFDAWKTAYDKGWI